MVKTGFMSFNALEILLTSTTAVRLVSIITLLLSESNGFLLAFFIAFYIGRNQTRYVIQWSDPRAVTNSEKNDHWLLSLGSDPNILLETICGAVQSHGCYVPFWFMFLFGFDLVKDQIRTRAELRLFIPLCIPALGQWFASHRVKVLLKPGSYAGCVPLLPYGSFSAQIPPCSSSLLIKGIISPHCFATPSEH